MAADTERKAALTASFRGNIVRLLLLRKKVEADAHAAIAQIDADIAQLVSFQRQWGDGSVLDPSAIEKEI